MAETTIGNNITVDGEISGTDTVRIEGTVKGRVATQNTVTVAPEGVVEADVETTEVLVEGQVTGNLVASDRVELSADSKMVGDIKAPRILIADGAGFKGHIDMDVE